MTTAAELCALAERCEKAIFPCPDDASAAEVVAIRSAICHLMTGRGYDTYSPDYVGSIDDAVRLVPEGWDWTAQTSFRKSNARANCDLTQESPFKPEDWKVTTARAATPALALCAAALKAHAASGTPTRRAETTGSVGEADGGPVPKADAQ